MVEDRKVFVMTKNLKKNSGFTMVELLAAIVVLGVMMMVAVPTVMEVLRDTRNSTYVDDAIRLVSTMEYRMNSDNMMPVPARGGCLVVNLTQIDNNTFGSAPYDGEYERSKSFVVARRWTRSEIDDADAEALANGTVSKAKEYSYYVRLMEQLPNNGGFRGVNLTEVDNLYAKNATEKYVVNASKDASVMFDLSLYVSDPATYSETNLKSELLNQTDGELDCSSVVIYASNRDYDDITSGEVS